MKIERTVADIEETIKEMDKQYDANFGEWVRNEDNLDLLSTNFKKYLYDYTEETFSEVLRWVTNSWTNTSKSILFKSLFIKDLFSDNPSNPERTDLQSKKIRMVKNMTEKWHSMDIAEFMLMCMSDLTGDTERQIYVLWMFEGVPSHKLTDIFVRIDKVLDWPMKVSIIKKNKILTQINPNSSI
ncbi:hypothetical protein NEFER03_0568 [Nematocida sp. LUAm3]|nr:hypothetical protein NEFER03_0568 [Nematocida sp. LUAm3]KAI5175535.1 hypothetical protein NEFER02_1441 [Nematocida sp. LUAm2]KAI5178435.1 hypothetical protein NEFER01_1582 [Nematocida sp. LUAm1]